MHQVCQIVPFRRKVLSRNVATTSRPFVSLTHDVLLRDTFWLQAALRIGNGARINVRENIDSPFTLLHVPSARRTVSLALTIYVYTYSIAETSKNVKRGVRKAR
jgi:hypothetical protein